MRPNHPHVDPNNPRAWAICDRGGEIVHHDELMPEQHYVAGRLMPNGLLVCRKHIDVPNPQLGGHRALRPDPVPVRNPRPPDGASGPIRQPFPFPRSQPIHDTYGNVITTGNGDVLLDMPTPVSYGIPDPLLDTRDAGLFDTTGGQLLGHALPDPTAPPLQDTHGAPLLDTDAFTMFPE